MRSTLFSPVGGRREDPGTHQKSRDRFVPRRVKNLFKMAAKTKGERTWVQDQNKQNGGKGELNVLKERRLITDPDPYHPNGSHP